MSQIQTQALEQQLEDMKKAVRLRDLAIKLSENKVFKELILQEFCVNESARYAHTSADPSLDANSRADALALAQAGGHLRRWLSVTTRMGNHAEGQLQELEQAITESRVDEDTENAEG